MSHWLTAFWTVFAKEIVENLRDRRALASALLYGPLFGPLLFAALTGFIIGQQKEQAEKPLLIAMAGIERAPNLVAFLRAQGATVEAAPEDAEAAIREQRLDLVLRLTAAFTDDWQRGEPARVELLSDGSRQTARPTVARARALLEGYSSQIGRLRLLARGVDPKLTTALGVVEVDLSTERSRGATMLAMLPYFLILCAFIGGMYIAIDATAGERERASLEPLLLNPVAASALVLGKIGATALFALASVLSCVAAFSIGLRFIPTAEFGLALELPPAAALVAALLLAPVALLASAVQTILASFARTFREAQTYLQFLMILPAVPSVMLIVSPLKPATSVLLTPLLGQSVLINRLARGEPLAMADIALSLAGTLACALLAMAVATRVYRSERLALGL